jgi:hypothetical protein
MVPFIHTSPKVCTAYNKTHIKLDVFVASLSFVG